MESLSRTLSASGRGSAASPYDAGAPSFDRFRALPDGVPEEIRAAVLAALAAPSPRLLDIGAGTGRIGAPFVAADDDYVGVDLSLGMLREFARRGAARLAQADAERLPFGDASFDAVLMVNVFGGMRGWRRVVGEARRVLRERGALLIGRAVAPDDGVDARMKQRLAGLLGEHGIATDRPNARADVERSLAAAAARRLVTVARWSAERTPRGFIERHRTGARFSALPGPVKDEALAALADWAAATFAGLDAPVRETHAFELQIFTFPATDARHA
jgi:demethylmenaquinone methyltransferase/2-methoxy-6-polyprenyl-1,4-benzoquinol methylase